MVGVVGGLVYGGVRFLGHRDANRAAGSAVLGFCGLATVAWLYCRHQFLERRRVVRDAFGKVNSGKIKMVHRLPGDEGEPLGANTGLVSANPTVSPSPSSQDSNPSTGT